jgi:hypothetical protein
MAFMVRTFYNEEKRQLERKVIEGLQLELNCFTLDTLHKFITKKATQYIESNCTTTMVDKMFKYSVKEFVIKLLDEKQPFLQLEIFGLEGVHRAHEKVHESLTIRMRDLKVINLLPGVLPGDREIVRFLTPPTVSLPHSYNFMLNLEKIVAPGKIGDNKWKYFNNIETNLGILITKISMEIFEKFYDFIWANQLQHPMLQDADDQKLDSELAEAFFWKPTKYLKKKKEIAKIKKKKMDEQNKGVEGVKHIPSAFRRFKVGATKIYMSYQAGIQLLVS